MSAFSIVLFDDVLARAWEPFALTRPASELLFGALTLRARAEQVFGGTCTALVAADHLSDFEEEGTPPVVAMGSVPVESDRLFLLSRAVPGWVAGSRLREQLREGPIVMDGTFVGWYSPAGRENPPREFLLDPTGSNAQWWYGEPLALPGRVLRDVWELMAGNAGQVTLDIAALFPAAQSPELPAGCHQFGSHPLVLGDGVRIEPGVVIDTSAGPVWLDRGVQVKAFTRLAGPSYVGPKSILLGGPIDTVSIGAVCRIRGEFAQSVCLSYVNKAHDGHIGHAYLGRWVNLGAETTNSDLKNNYGSVRLWTPGGDADTGEMKVGCFLGDHVKTGIGLLLNTGTVVGAGSNIYGAAMPPKFVPPFSWGTGGELTEYRVDKFLDSAEYAMSRRDVRLSDPSRAQLEQSWRRGREMAAAASSS